MNSSGKVRVYLISLLAAALCALAVHIYVNARYNLKSPDTAPVNNERPPTIVLIVMDAVRKDFTAVCNDIPQNIQTTPTLKTLIKRGTSYCRMAAPGSWTLPVHASIFTGALPFIHGADFQADGSTIKGVDNNLRINRLRRDIPTLAELMSAHGYQTVLVSGNPLIGETTGTDRGFQKTWTSPDFPRGGKALVAHQVLQMLRSLNPRKPLFLAVNIMIAHGPFEAPDNTAPLDIFEGFRTSFFARFVSGRMSESEESRLLTRLRTYYRYGVKKADEDLKNILDHLRAFGWLDGQESVFVTSDHGEMLGEHGLLDHDRNVFQENTDVFLVATGPRFRPGHRVNRLVQSQDIFSTVADAVGMTISPPEHSFSLFKAHLSRISITVSRPDKFWASLSDNRIGIFEYVAVENESGHRIVKSTAQDPLEKTADRVLRAMENMTNSSPISPSEDVTNALKAMGYVE